MRISTAYMQYQGTKAMTDRYSELSRTQNQLATGSRVVTPSDDPVAATKMLPLNELKERNHQYNRNGDAAEARLVLEDETLGAVTNVLIRAHELAVQGLNDTLGPEGRNAIAEELRQRLDELKALANTRDSNSEYIFAGDNILNAPVVEGPAGTFTYTGDSAQRNVQLSASRQVAMGDPGDDVFFNVPFSGGGNQDVFTTLNNFINDMAANTPDDAVLDDFQGAIDNILSIRARVGARLNTVDNQRILNEGTILQSEKTLSELRDLDMAEAVSRLNLQMTALQVSQQTYNRVQNLSLFNYI